MEDAVSISDNVAGHACFAVFDGHGGEKATVLAKQFLPLQLEKLLEQESSKEEAAHQAFAAMDERMQKQLAEEAKVLPEGAQCMLPSRTKCRHIVRDSSMHCAPSGRRARPVEPGGLQGSCMREWKGGHNDTRPPSRKE